MKRKLTELCCKIESGKHVITSGIWKRDGISEEHYGNPFLNSTAVPFDAEY